MIRIEEYRNCSNKIIVLPNDRGDNIVEYTFSQNIISISRLSIFVQIQSSNMLEISSKEGNL